MQCHCPLRQTAPTLSGEKKTIGGWAMIKIGINGFGRIGRMAFRAAMERADVQVVAVNDLLELPHLAYLLRHDSVHGRFGHDAAVKDRSLMVDGRATPPPPGEGAPPARGGGAV